MGSGLRYLHLNRIIFMAKTSFTLSQSNPEAILFYTKFVEKGREEGQRRDFHYGACGIKTVKGGDNPRDTKPK